VQKPPVFICLAIAIFSGAACAEERLPEASYDWSGLYAGGSVGYGGGVTTNSWTNPSSEPAWFADGDIGYSSFMIGAHAGVLHQLDRWAIGFEADYNRVGFRGNDRQVAGVLNGLEIDQFASARARAGWTSDRMLVYATGGVAWGDIRKTDTTLLNQSVSANVLGWAAGAGVERAVGDNFRIRLEYQHVDLGVADVTFGQGWASYRHRANGITFDTVRAGFSYRF